MNPLAATSLVYHCAGPRTATNQTDRATGCTMFEQRCSRCGALLDMSPSLFVRFPVGDELERLESTSVDGHVIVKYTAVPLYDIDARFREQGLQAPRCQPRQPQPQTQGAGASS